MSFKPRHFVVRVCLLVEKLKHAAYKLENHLISYVGKNDNVTAVNE